MEKFSKTDMILGNMAIKYFVISGLAYLIFWVIFKENFIHRFIQSKFPSKKRIRFEIKYSVLSMLIMMTFNATVFYFFLDSPYTKLYGDIHQFSLAYYIFSYFALFFLHDTYFYWTHRLMHHPKIYKHVHLIHHISINPSPWAAFSFHPWEAIISNAFIMVVVFLIPVHSSALIIFSLLSFILNVKGHLGFEFFPKGFISNKWVNWNTSATHHCLHHERFNHNFGFYFTFWDKIMGTEAPEYIERFNEVVSRKPK